MKSLYYLPLAILLIICTTITNVIATPTHNSQQSARYHVETILNGLTKKWTSFRDFERYCLPSNTGRKDTTLSVVCQTLMDLFGGYKHLLSSRSGFGTCSESSCDTQSCGTSNWLNIAGIERLEEPGWYGSKKLGVFMKAAINTLVEQNSDEELRKFIGELRELHREIRGNSHLFAKRDVVSGEASTHSQGNVEENQLRRTNSSVSTVSTYSSANEEGEEDPSISPAVPDARASSSFESARSEIEQELIETFTESIEVFLDHQFVSNDTELIFESVRVIESPDGDLLIAFKLSEDGITRVYNPPAIAQMRRFEIEQRRRPPREEWVPLPIRHTRFLDLVDKIADKYFGLFNRCEHSDNNIAILTTMLACFVIFMSSFAGVLALLHLVGQFASVKAPIMCLSAGAISAVMTVGFGCVGVGKCCCSLADRRERNLWEEMIRARNANRTAAAENIDNNANGDNDDNNDNINNSINTMTLEEAVINTNVLEAFEENFRQPV